MTAEETPANWNQQLETVRAKMLRSGGKPERSERPVSEGRAPTRSDKT